MTSVSPASPASPPARPRGRPRDAERDDAITAACIELVSEVGFDRLRVQDVADRAGVGLATIYRRWPTKRDLLFHVVAAHEKPTVPPTGDARHDLLALLGALAGELTSKSAEFIPSILVALRDDPELGEAIRQNSLCPIRESFQAILRQEPSLSEADIDTRADVGPAMLLHRVLFMGDVADEALLGAIADVMLGVSTSPRSRPSRPKRRGPSPAGRVGRRVRRRARRGTPDAARR